jgi:DNA-binding transcriptional regulator GbsR (MarR family)
MSRAETSRRVLAEGYTALFVEAAGLPPSTGRIFSCLLLSSVPLSQADLRSALSLSDGSVSEGLRLLAEAGLVERAGPPRARPAYFQVQAGGWAGAALTMLQNLKVTFDLAGLTLEHLDKNKVQGRSHAFAAALKAMYDVLMEELPPAVERSLVAAEHEWAAHEEGH